MKLYLSDRGSNPQKVRIFLAEKNASVATEMFDFMAGDHRRPEYLKINSLGKLPALVLDDGTVITESVAICRYLESLFPEPALFGTTPQQQALVEMWSRRIELEVSRPCVDVIQHSAPFFADTVVQNAEYAATQRDKALNAFVWLNNELDDGRPFLAGETFSMADIILITTVALADLLKISMADELTALHSWHARVQERPSYHA